MAAKPDPDLGEAIQRMFDERFPEGLLTALRRRFTGSAYADYEEAISQGFEKLLVKGPIENPRGYVTTIAFNAMQHVLRRAAYERVAVTDDEEELPGDYWADPTFETVASEAAHVFIRSVVEGWESRNVKTATLLVIEAAAVGEPLSGEELAERLEYVLGQDVLSATARQWRKRGLDRLREELVVAETLEEKETP